MDDLFEDPDDSVLKMEQFSDAFIGIAETNGKAPCACYSKKNTKNSKEENVFRRCSQLF